MSCLKRSYIVKFFFLIASVCSINNHPAVSIRIISVVTIGFFIFILFFILFFPHFGILTLVSNNVLLLCFDRHIALNILGANGAKCSRFQSNHTRIKPGSSMAWFSGSKNTFSLDRKNQFPTFKYASYSCFCFPGFFIMFLISRMIITLAGNTISSMMPVEVLTK